MPTESYYPCSAGCANCPRRQQCAVSSPLEVFLQENPYRGLLRIQAFRGPQTFPVQGVAVTVSHAFSDGSEYVFFTGTTDESGIIDAISLRRPAPTPCRRTSPTRTPSTSSALRPTASCPWRRWWTSSRTSRPFSRYS